MSSRTHTILLSLGLMLTLGVTAQAQESLPERSDVVSMAGQPLTLLGEPVEIGDKAPDFTALNTEFQPVSLSDYTGKVRIITAFPSIDTEVCSLQTRRFNQEAAGLPNVQILTVSADLPFALGRFCAAEGIENALTLSDHRDFDFARKYGFWIKDMRLLARGTVIVDQDGVVRYVEFVPDIGQEPDYAKAVAIARELAGKT